jgi:AraC family transcriptional regulator of adaptative response / DNA-3-methyladenine glycosylase II
LLDDTDLSIARVAQAAGFNSVRQLNRVIKDVFRFSPQELRAKRRVPDRCVADGGLELRVPYRPPLAWRPMLQFLGARAIPGVESVDVDEGVYRRTVELAGSPGVIEVWDEPEREALRLRAHLPDYSGLVHLVARVRRLFDLDADPDAIDGVLARDRTLRPFVRARRGVRVPGAIDGFEIGVRAVLGQQVSVAAATRLAGKLVAAHGRPVPGLASLGLSHLFPEPSVLARTELTGIPAARARAVEAFADAVATGKLDLDAHAGLDDTIRSLRELPGFGEWTAHFVAMRACGERDAFPAGDAGLRRVLGNDMATRAQRWRPWRAYGAMHVWLGRARS